MRKFILEFKTIMSHDESDDSDYSHFSSSQQQMYTCIDLETHLTTNLEGGLKAAKIAGKRAFRSLRKSSLWMSLTKRPKRSEDVVGLKALKISRNNKLPYFKATSMSSIFTNFSSTFSKLSRLKRSIRRSTG